MRLENDKNFTFLYNEEFEKIPAFFKFSRKRCIAALIVMGAFFTAAMIFLSLFQDSAKYERMAVMGAYSLGVNDYNYAFLYAMIICFAVIALIAAWMSIAKVFERMAFKKASNLANMIYLSERHKAEIDWQNWKMQNRDY